MGLLTMLCMEDAQGLKGRKEELNKVGEFLVKVTCPPMVLRACYAQSGTDSGYNGGGTRWDYQSRGSRSTLTRMIRSRCQPSLTRP
eukprot:3423428-Rhodomonas_salina.2